MKKVLLFAGVLAVMGATSCKKDYTCECTTTDTSDTSFNVKSSFTYNAKKKDAEASCSALSVSNGTSKTECEIK